MNNIVANAFALFGSVIAFAGVIGILGKPAGLQVAIREPIAGVATLASTLIRG